MNKARKFIYLSLYCMLIVTCFSIGIFCLASRTINSYYEIYYTYTPSTLSKSLLQQYLTENPTITEVYFDAFDSEERTNFTINETTYQTADCILLGDTSENDDESVLAYTNSQKTQMYILCTEKITFPVNCETMFQGCSALTKIQFENIDTKNVTSMSHMFNGASGLTSITFPSDIDTSKVKSMYGMFYHCRMLTTLDLSMFDTSRVNVMNSMFYGCTKLSDLNIESFNTSLVTGMYNMFMACSSLVELDLSHFETARVTDMYNMFTSCSSLTRLDLSNFDTSSIDTGKREKKGFSRMFYGCSSLTSLDLSSFNTKNVTNMTMMFLGCKSLKTLNISSFDTSHVKNMAAMFHDVGLTTLDLSHFITSNVTDMHQMFYHCRNLVSLDISSFDLSSVTRMAYMFGMPTSTKLKNIYIGDGWTTAALIKTTFETLSFGDAFGDTEMFKGCTSLPNFNSSYTGKTYAHAGTGGYLTYKSE